MNEFGLFDDTSVELFTLYSLPMVHLKGGGGGGSSGEVSYPAYMESKHEDWLNDLDTLITGTTSPYLSAVTWCPDATLEDQIASVASFSTAVSNLHPLSDWEAATATAKAKWDAILGDDELNEDIKAFSDLLDDEVNDTVLPQFKAGMREANAVMTSAFVMGEAKIWSGKVKEVGKYGTDLKLKAAQQKTQAILDGTRSIGELQKHQINMEEAVSRLYVEAYRMKIVAKVEECQRQFELDEKDAQWHFDMYQYGVDMLGGIGGGTVGAGAKPTSQAQSALGGALSGAATGAMVGGVPGAVIGGIIGLGASFL